ncbi:MULTISPECIES: hypothetical protein [unclassified Kitasatospora]|uniref:hypothetical protein n=1 Tax=unclassified Kitasatospora TaxID=2633591 RepID=UPI000709C050|nr:MULTISPECIES: hypothetical protein [unclassified Kitasatospora]KQV19556.1 hypothetical protein ASC99_23030 [Kitasatospora sp. Root107]KRB72923.1 hypothetical protein ASE03_21920 [Kitasatospora sp. Root187]
MAAVDAARARAQAVLRVRGRALGVAALPAALAVVLFAGRFTGRIGAPGSADAAAWDLARWVVGVLAVLVLLATWLVARTYTRAVPPRTPAVPIAESAAPELYRQIGELAERLGVPAPSGIALTPDCDSWLEEVHRPGRRRPTGRPVPVAGEVLSGGPDRAAEPAPVLVIGSPFLWWMRAGELRALLAPVVAGTAAAADPDIAAARRFLRGLDASLGEPRRGPAALLDRLTKLLLNACREHSAELERAVAAAASEQAKSVDYGLRIAAQEQVGLAYAGWDRLLTRVALPAWRLGRHPAHLNAGVVAALTELSRRDRLAEGYGTRLGDRPACDLLEEPGSVDAAVSLLAAEVLFGEPFGTAGTGWRELDWADYPAEVVELGWRGQAEALRAVLGDGVPEQSAPTLHLVLARLAEGGGEPLAAALAAHLARTEQIAPPLQVVRSGRDLLVDHVTALVCLAAVDTGRGRAGMDWLDGPVLLLGGTRRPELGALVADAVEQGKDAPLRSWLEAAGLRLAGPVRL